MTVVRRDGKATKREQFTFWVEPLAALLWPARPSLRNLRQESRGPDPRHTHISA